MSAILPYGSTDWEKLSFNEEWGGYWSNEDKTIQQIIEVRDIVLQDESYKNAMGVRKLSNHANGKKNFDVNPV